MELTSLFSIKAGEIPALGLVRFDRRWREPVFLQDSSIAERLKVQPWVIYALYFWESPPLYLRNLFVKSRRMAFKKRGITFVELEMLLTAHWKVYSLVRNFHGFQHLLDVRNPPDLTYQQILFSPFSGMKNAAFFFEFSAIATQRLKKQTGKQKPNEDNEDSRYDPLYYVLSIKATYNYEQCLRKVTKKLKIQLNKNT